MQTTSRNSNIVFRARYSEEDTCICLYVIIDCPKTPYVSVCRFVGLIQLKPTTDGDEDHSEIYLVRVSIISACIFHLTFHFWRSLCIFITLQHESASKSPSLKIPSPSSRRYRSRILNSENADTDVPSGVPSAVHAICFQPVGPGLPRRKEKQ